jgi:AAA ATPase domain
MVGAPPNLAARLQAAAAPGTVVVGPTTRRLLAGLFEYRDLGAIEVKGFDTAVKAYQVVRQSTTESRFEALRTSTTPLVGRDEEIDLLLRRWAQAKGGDGQVVLICGEPGIGKSRITQTLVERLKDEPHTRLRYFCVCWGLACWAACGVLSISSTKPKARDWTLRLFRPRIPRPMR